jgi:glycosyltransferase involved in cell wall biosynthesis
MVKLVVGMTLYNREKYVSLAIESVLSQSYQDFKLIIYDDYSTDNSLTIAKAYADKDDRITIIAGETNLGHTAALCNIFEHVDSEYICWVDSDDILMPNALQIMVTKADQHPDYGLFYSQHININQDGVGKDIGYRCRIKYDKDALLINFLCHHFRFIRKSVYDQIGGLNREFLHGEDYDLVLRLSEVTKVYQLHIPLYKYRSHGDTLSTKSHAGQVKYAKLAVEAAIGRRGLADGHYLHINDTHGFQIKRTSDDTVLYPIKFD